MFCAPPTRTILKPSSYLLMHIYVVVYVGESASLSFLETVKSAVQVAVGQCAFTNEPARNPMIESTPKIRFEVAEEPSLDGATAQSLASHFFLAVSGVFDLFDPPWLKNQLENWGERSSQRSKSTSAIVHLALAVGSQARAQGDQDDLLAEQCFAYGRQLTMFNLMDDPSLATIQAVLLITYYMMAACQYNAAFINLGVAARAAYTLGIHLHETNTVFGGEEGLSRERAWKSLRVCDLFLAASLGRPPMTSEAVSNVTWVPVKSLSDQESPGVAEQLFSAMFRICNVFERILVEVYAKKAVSLELAKSISQQHRQWTEDLPRMLRVDGFEEPDDSGGGRGISPSSFRLSSRHGSSIITMAYYYSIVLLTRPFLTFHVRQASGKETQATTGGSLTSKACVATYADSCVNSAIRGIDIAHDYVFELSTPRRQPLVVNSVFISALCLGLASLDTSGRQKWPVDSSLDRAVKILEYLGQLNTQSARYAGLCRQLREAASIYAARRDNTLLRENDQIARSIFGDIGAASRGRCSSEGSAGNVESPWRPTWSVSASEGNGIGEPMTPPSFELGTIHEASMLLTSGVLAGQIPGLSHTYDQCDSGLGAAPHTTLTGSNASDPLSSYFLDQDVPLFPLTSAGSSSESYFTHNHLC